MKSIKIRFIKHKDRYTIQKKGWFRWKDIYYTIDMGYGSVSYDYAEKTKEENAKLEKEKEIKNDKPESQPTAKRTLTNT